ncbi:MAG: TatD family hydrolase [Candidatus Pacebacteria bacterium]|nr:TatD family hydrolase [Candidatus Paceibacterota bacterium]
MTFKHIDIHSHLNFSQFDADREEIIAKMKEEGMATITVGTDKKTSKEAVELASRNPHLFATIGIHPTHIEESEGVWEVFDEAYYESLLSPKVVAIGECGLDYFRTPIDANEARMNANKQKELFVAQIDFALKHDLPLMIHGRPSKGTTDAYEDIIEILTTKPGIRGNIHFFVGDIPTAKKFLDLGFTLSFDGPITFVPDYDEVIKFVPEDMIMAETDSPFAAPVPHRGKRNEPLFVSHIIKRIAELRGLEEEYVSSRMLQTAKRVFPRLG